MRVVREENFRRDPSASAVRLAVVNVGVELAADSVAGQWVRVQLTGWVWARSLASTARDGFGLVVQQAEGENLRATPNGAVLARLANGCLLEEVERRAGWVRVRRVGWMYRPSVAPAGAAPAPPPPTASATPDPADTTAGLDRAVTAGATVLHTTPGGDEAGTLQPDTPVRILVRSGEWVRVQTEGWIRETDLQPAAPGVLVGVSGAEVRARPAEYEGRLVQWVVQFIAVQPADELRPEIPPGHRYMLARGPLPEAGFVYVVLTEEQREAVERLAPLTGLVIVGRIRSARSRYLGNPVLTLVDFAVRES